jgi:hypothetical protein
VTRQAHYVITPQMHALMRLQKVSQAKQQREEKMAKLRRDMRRESNERHLERYGVTRDDPRAPIVAKAVEAAAKKGMDVRDDRVARSVADKALADHERTLNRETTDVVYYLRVGDLVKIGTTNNLKRRLRAYPPGTVVLATETGSFQREAQRHEQFADYLAERKEWFTLGPDLIKHIEDLRTACRDLTTQGHR